MFTIGPERMVFQLFSGRRSSFSPWTTPPTAVLLLTSVLTSILTPHSSITNWQFPQGPVLCLCAYLASSEKSGLCSYRMLGALSDGQVMVSRFTPLPLRGVLTHCCNWVSFSNFPGKLCPSGTDMVSPATCPALYMEAHFINGEIPAGNPRTQQKP